MRVPTVKMYKGSRIITVNECDSIRFAAIGWSRKDESTKPLGKPKQDVQLDDDDILLDASAE